MSDLSNAQLNQSLEAEESGQYHNRATAPATPTAAAMMPCPTTLPLTADAAPV